MQIHTHNNCFSSLSFKDDGIPILLAEDLEGAHRHCFETCMRYVFGQTESTGYVPTTATIYLDERARDCLSVLSPDAGHCALLCDDVQSFRNFEGVCLPMIWDYAWFPDVVSAGPGDYGYIDHNTGLWTSLGTLAGSVPQEELFWWGLRDFVDDDCITEIDGWDARTWSYSLHTGSDRVSAIDLELADTVEGRFVWLRACDVAMQHDIRLQDLILARGVRYAWGMHVLDTTPGTGEAAHHNVNDCNDASHDNGDASRFPVPDTVYFHQLPPTANGEPPTPFGYWSLDAEPAPGPWPELRLPGIELKCSVRKAYAHLSGVQAELIACFDRERKARVAELSRSGAPRFQEVA